MRGFLTILCITSWFAYGLGERWVIAQENVAQAQVESCEILSEFRQGILAVTDAHDRTRTTFYDWLNGSATVEDVTLAIASQGEKVESLRFKVK